MSGEIAVVVVTALCILANYFNPVFHLDVGSRF